VSTCLYLVRRETLRVRARARERETLLGNNVRKNLKARDSESTSEKKRENAKRVFALRRGGEGGAFSLSLSLSRSHLLSLALRF